MPVYNGLPFLNDAIDSVLSQTLSDFEFICIDDASTDGSAEVISAVQDPRWHWVRNRRRSGLSKALNRGLRMARGAYWARMDADDISLPRRLEAQAHFLDANPDVSMVGAWAQTLGLPREQVWKLPATAEEIQAEMLFNSALVHSAVMLRRKDFLSKGFHYDPTIERAQDYDLWERAARRLCFANLQEVLLHYRIHAGQVGYAFGVQQAETAAAVRARQLTRLGLRVTKRDLELHNHISIWKFEPNSTFLSRVDAWLRGIEQANGRKKIYDDRALRAVLERRWWAACRSAAVHNKQAWQLYSSSHLAEGGLRSFVDKAVFWVKTQWPR
ncbi:MAG: glycosyltransferase family 2 protein [Anaerolineales bacterium]|nr:MAG: glycosyltransferase family 2 protein [Anaerolineales bacterium]